MLQVGIAGGKWRRGGGESVGQLSCVPKGLLAEGLGTTSMEAAFAVAKTENVQIWAG